ncbi:hypothetical protein BJV82DRAFT_674942 [Fennellomyces sp. T-0311]|nr:hypothetical protein BJV82DRAFT_674942 [Fennellomyces sp. T-0311]
MLLRYLPNCTKAALAEKQQAAAVNQQQTPVGSHEQDSMSPQSSTHGQNVAPRTLEQSRTQLVNLTRFTQQPQTTLRDSLNMNVTSTSPCSSSQAEIHHHGNMTSSLHRNESVARLSEAEAANSRQVQVMSSSPYRQYLPPPEQQTVPVVVTYMPSTSQVAPHFLPFVPHTTHFSHLSYSQQVPYVACSTSQSMPSESPGSRPMATISEGALQFQQGLSPRLCSHTPEPSTDHHAQHLQMRSQDYSMHDSDNESIGQRNTQGLNVQPLPEPLHHNHYGLAPIKTLDVNEVEGGPSKLRQTAHMELFLRNAFPELESQATTIRLLKELYEIDDPNNYLYRYTPTPQSMLMACVVSYTSLGLVLQLSY